MIISIRQMESPDRVEGNGYHHRFKKESRPCLNPVPLSSMNSIAN